MSPQDLLLGVGVGYYTAPFSSRQRACAVAPERGLYQGCDECGIGRREARTGIRLIAVNRWGAWGVRLNRAPERGSTCSGVV